MQQSKQKVIRVVSLLKMWQKIYQIYPFSLRRPNRISTARRFLAFGIKWAVPNEKLPSNMLKMGRFRSSCTHPKYHPGPKVCSPFIHSEVYPMILLAKALISLRMRRLIWAVAVRICPKTRFLRERPKWCVHKQPSSSSFIIELFF